MTGNALSSEGSPGVNWYGTAAGNLEQGDVFFDFRIVAPMVADSAENVGYVFGTRLARVIVLTQSCDIPKREQKDLILAEVHDYDTLVRAGHEHLKKSEYKRALARGTAIGEFLLPPSPDGRIPWALVNFRDLFIVPKAVLFDSMRETPGDVTRIVSPYREYLSQAFARFVMRVGLPATLSEFEHYKGSVNRN